jgi:hypothetical protein
MCVLFSVHQSIRRQFSASHLNGRCIYRRKFKALKFTVLFWRVSKLSCKRTNIISINNVYGNNWYLLSEPYEMRKHIMWFHTAVECSVRLVTRGLWTDKLWSVMYSHRWKCCCHDNKFSCDLRYTIRGTLKSASIHDKGDVKICKHTR